MFTQDKRGKVNSTHDGFHHAHMGGESAAPINRTEIERPNDLLAHYHLAQSYCNSERWQDARRALQRTLSIDPGHERALCDLAEVCCRLGDHAQAVACYKENIRFHPDNYRSHQRLGDIYQRIGFPDEAAYAYTAALKIRPDDPDVIASLALALTRLGKKEQALICYQKAISCRPGDHTLYNQYATVLEKCNRLPEARLAVENSLSVRPQNDGAIVNLATIEYREGNYENAYRLFKHMDLNGKTFEAAATIKQKEGLALDKLRRYSEAFECFRRSNQFAMQTPAYHYLHAAYEDDWKQMAGMAAAYSSSTIATWERPIFEAAPNTPVFLVGFPRSGTTLLEQVLNAHPQIVTLDERSPLQRIIEDYASEGRKPERLETVSKGEIDDYRKAYFELLQTRTGTVGQNRIVVDKLPLNILHLPLIYRFFPDARIIVALRHPLDCILSNFIQRFKLNKKMMNFLTLENTARFYDLTMGLYLQYRASIPLPMHELKYEALTENIEKETKHLAAFLCIEWSPDMIQYHRQAAKRVINTPSYTEVIKPIHRRAVYRWRNYRTQLEPIVPTVKAYIDRFGYDLKA